MLLLGLGRGTHGARHADGQAGAQGNNAGNSATAAGTHRNSPAAADGGGEAGNASTVGIDALSSIFSRFFGGGLGGGTRMSRAEIAAVRRARRRRYLRGLQAMESNSLTVLSAYLGRTEGREHLARPRGMLADDSLTPAQAQSLGLQGVQMSEVTRAALSIIDTHVAARSSDFLSEVAALGGPGTELAPEARERLSNALQAARKDAARAEDAIRTAMQRIDEQEATAQAEGGSNDGGAAAGISASAAASAGTGGDAAGAVPGGGAVSGAAPAGGGTAGSATDTSAVQQQARPSDASAPGVGESSAQASPEPGVGQPVPRGSQDRQRRSQRGSRSGRGSGHRSRRARYEYLPLVLIAYTFVMQRAECTIARYNAAMQESFAGMRQALGGELGASTASTFPQTQVRYCD